MRTFSFIACLVGVGLSGGMRAAVARPRIIRPTRTVSSRRGSTRCGWARLVVRRRHGRGSSGARHHARRRSRRDTHRDLVERKRSRRLRDPSGRHLHAGPWRLSAESADRGGRDVALALGTHGTRRRGRRAGDRAGRYVHRMRPRRRVVAARCSSTSRPSTARTWAPSKSTRRRRRSSRASTSASTRPSADSSTPLPCGCRRTLITPPGSHFAA